jgi:hypothetical protein
MGLNIGKTFAIVDKILPKTLVFPPLPRAILYVGFIVGQNIPYSSFKRKSKQRITLWCIAVGICKTRFIPI